MLDIVKVERYGKMVSEIPSLEPLRKEVCMCHQCGAFKPNDEANCPIAQKFFAICKEHGNAFILTRCGSWVRPSLKEEK